MTIYEFVMLSKTEQFEATWNGVFLSSRIEGHLGFNLYDLGGFYVEVKYHVENNIIEQLRAFRKTKSLDLYVDEITLPKLF